MVTLSGIEKMKKAELIEACEELGIDPPKTVADMRYALKRAYDDEASAPAAAKKSGNGDGKLEVVKGGDVASPKGSAPRILCHFVAKGLRWSKRGTMGRITNAFGKEPVVQHDALLHKHKMGMVQYVAVSGKNEVASMVCLAKPPPGNPPPFDEAAFSSCLEDIASRALKTSSSVHIDIDPRTPKLEYNEVLDTIKEELVEKGLTVLVYPRGSSTAPTSTISGGKTKRDSTSSSEEKPKKKAKTAPVEDDEGAEESDAEAPAPSKSSKKPAAAEPKEPPDGGNKDERRKYIAQLIKNKTVEDFPLEGAEVKLVPVDKDSEEFWDLEERFNGNLQGRNEDYVGKRIKDGKKPIRFILAGAERVENLVLECRFELKKLKLAQSGGTKETRERVSFHGTHPKNCKSICRTSLLRFKHKLNPCKTQSDDGWFGKNTMGVYVSRYADYTLKYANRLCPLKPEDTAKTILFRTLPGKSKHVQKIQAGMEPTAGYDSHSSPDFLEWYLFDEDQLCPEYVLQVRAEEDTRTKADDGLVA
eukprot:TRINITY_DN1076_c1_g2_i1.p1 TRINITY_DN1076_c1_g2~~TRINITY_DN1076_c1_g2_i1.p1  ORF type:complete len:538 (+),score=99.17 TRINITY_DN1076_c1_g2_i1:24-1616(+)